MSFDKDIKEMLLDKNSTNMFFDKYIKGKLLD